MATTTGIAFNNVKQQVYEENTRFSQQLAKRRAILGRPLRIIDYVSFMFYEGIPATFTAVVHEAIVAKMESALSDFQNIPDINANVIQISMLIHRQRDVLPVMKAKGWDLSAVNLKAHEVEQLSHDIVTGSSTASTDAFIGYDLWRSLGYYTQKWYRGAVAMTGPVEWYLKKAMNLRAVNQVDANWYTWMVANEIGEDPFDVNTFMYITGKKIGK